MTASVVSSLMSAVSAVPPVLLMSLVSYSVSLLILFIYLEIYERRQQAKYRALWNPDASRPLTETDIQHGNKGAAPRHKGDVKRLQQKKQKPTTGFLDLPGGQCNIRTSSIGNALLVILRDHDHELDTNAFHAEIRNIIYKFICDEPVGSDVGSILPPTADESSIAIIADRPLYIVPLARVCRQIREEYLSMLSAQHRIDLSTLRAARTWHVTIHPEVFHTKRLGRSNDWIITQKVTVPNGSVIKSRKTQDHAITVSQSRRRVKILCQYREWIDQWTTPSITMFFDVDCGLNMVLAQSSQHTIEILLTRNAFGKRDSSFKNFLHLADQISKLDLQLKIVTPPKEPGMVTPFTHFTFEVALQFSSLRPRFTVKQILRGPRGKQVKDIVKPQVLGRE